MSTAAPDVAVRWSRWTQLLAGVLAAALLVVAARALVHGVAGTGWSSILALLHSLSPVRLVTLALVWFGGLAVYSTVLAAALPGLGVRRSLLLNLSGSAVANLLPLGGAVATGLNWRMVRSWGHTTSSFRTFCVLTNGLDVVTKLVLPVAAVAMLVVGGDHVPLSIWGVAGACTVVLAAAGGLVLRLRGGRLRAIVASCAGSLRARPLPLVVGSAAYLAAQVLLLQLSLDACGLHPGLAVVVTCAALERLATLVPITPGGAGLAELGAVAWLVVAGLDPVGSVAGVLLYRLFIVGMEIPAGAALLAGWTWLRHGPTASVATS